MKKSSKKDDSFDIIKGNPVLAKELITAMNPSLRRILMEKMVKI